MVAAIGQYVTPGRVAWPLIGYAFKAERQGQINPTEVRLIQFTDAILDTLIAPNVSTFKTADIPDMSGWAKESQYWVANYFLNSLTAAFAAPMNAYAYNFLRRVQFAFSEHHLAREATIAFLSHPRSPTRYAEALFHWETYLGQSWHAYNLLIKAWKGKAFEQNDGSVEQRLNALYNQMKHVESRIENEQMIPGATVPVWLENEGLRSVDSTLSFVETAEILKDLTIYADALSNPATANEELNRAGR